MDHSKPCRVLLVEDDPADADLVIEYLSEIARPAHDVLHVGRLSEAVPRVVGGLYDVVLLDMHLPDAIGLECVATLRGLAPAVPVVVLTGMDDDELALQCLAAGAQDYLSKGELKPRPLARAIAHAVARAAERVERARADLLQARLAAIVEASGDAIVGMTIDGLITTWNRGAARMFLYSADEAVGQRFEDIIRAPDAEAAAVQRERIRGVARGVGVDVVEELVRLRRDGSPMTLAIVVNAVRDPLGRVTDVAVVCRDVTEAHRQAEELRRGHARLLNRERQMRALTARLNAVREEERTRISREVHDGLGQLLTGLKLDLRWVARRLDGKTSLAPEVLLDKLAEIEDLADRTIAAVQRIAVELRPSALDSLGLISAVRDEARRFEARSGVPTKVEVGSGLKPPPGDVSTALFRILQELLTNAARHAGAHSLQIELSDDGRAWRMHVCDDGIGIDPEVAARADSLGLLGMVERAAAIGGTISIARGREGGTAACVTVPRDKAGGSA